MRLYSCTKTSTESTQYIFGGSYTSNKMNVVTNDKTCAAELTAVRIINDIFVCFSQQIVKSYNPPKFGGIFSCQANYSVTGTETCPTGFSVYVLGVIEGNCMLYVCLQLKTQNIRTLPSISLPPYFDVTNQMNGSSTMVNMMNNNSANNPKSASSIPTVRMNPILFYRDSNSASKVPAAWLFIPIAMAYFI